MKKNTLPILSCIPYTCLRALPLLKKSHFTTRYPHRSRHTRPCRSSSGNFVNMLPFYVPCAWRVTHSTTLTGVPVFVGYAAGKLRRCFWKHHRWNFECQWRCSWATLINIEVYKVFCANSWTLALELPLPCFSEISIYRDLAMTSVVWLHLRRTPVTSAEGRSALSRVRHLVLWRHHTSQWVFLFRVVVPYNLSSR